MQNYKGDANELKMQAVTNPVFDLQAVAQDDFMANGYQSTPFLLMLYDEGRAPFSDRILRDTFVSFVKEALANFPFTGTAECYLSILRSIFGESTEVRFEIPAAGKLSIDVIAVDNLFFGFQCAELDEDTGELVLFDMVDELDNNLDFRIVPGIESASELELLLSEIIPMGIFSDVTFGFYDVFTWTTSLGHTMVDQSQNVLIFIEA